MLDHFEAAEDVTFGVGQRLSLLVFENDLADAAGILRLKMQGIFAADDESAGIFRRHDPLRRTRTAETIVWFPRKPAPGHRLLR